MQRQQIIEAYNILGIKEGASIVEITKAYRRLAKKYHPDSHQENVDYAHKMMVKINEAYSIVKKYLESGASFESRNEDNYYRESRRTEEEYGYRYSNNALWKWIEKFERERREREERRRREIEKRRREEKAFREFFERLAKEQFLEKEDRKKYEILLKHTMNTMEGFFKNNLHNQRFRERPYMKSIFDEFMERYELLLEKSKKLAGEFKSHLYSTKSKYLYEFLNSFIFDAVTVLPYPKDVSASSLRMYEDAVYVSERFMYSFFSQKEAVPKKSIMELLKRSLNGYEMFLKTFPDSPLLTYAEAKIELLEKFYRAFLR